MNYWFVLCHNLFHLERDRGKIIFSNLINVVKFVIWKFSSNAFGKEKKNRVNDDKSNYGGFPSVVLVSIRVLGIQALIKSWFLCSWFAPTRSRLDIFMMESPEILSFPEIVIGPQFWTQVHWSGWEIFRL